MTYSEYFIITLICVIGLVAWLMIVATRVAMNQATSNALRVMRQAAKINK